MDIDYGVGTEIPPGKLVAPGAFFFAGTFVRCKSRPDLSRLLY